jgi:hypothetical protein
MGHEGGLLCIPCFDKELSRSGRFVRWVPTMEKMRRDLVAAPRERTANR